MARSRRDYVAEERAFRRRSLRYRRENAGRGRYLARMAKGQRAGLAPQQARGHKAGKEHLTQKRIAGRKRYADLTTRRGHAEFIEQRSHEVSGHRMGIVIGEWNNRDFEHQRRIMEAREYAIRHRGMHSWAWYMETYNLEDDDGEIFGYE